MATLCALMLMLSCTMVAFATENGSGTQPEQSTVAAEEETSAPDEGDGDSDGPPAGVDLDHFGTPDNSDGLADSLTADFDNTTADVFLGYFQIAVGVVGVVAVLIAVLALVKSRKKGTSNKGFNAAVTAVTAVSLAGAVVVNVGTSMYSGPINNVMTRTTASSDAEITSTATDWKQLTYDIAGEGMVLMTNQNNTLPLTSGKVNLLGYYAYNPYYSGTGSSSVSASDAVSIVQSLEDAGFEINPACIDMYDITEASDKDIGFNGDADLSINELKISEWTGDASFENMKAYSDTAIVVLGRTGGEGNDLTVYGEVDGANYLQLSSRERDLLEAASQTFDKLIVVINAANAMEMGFLDEYNVDACIWAGEPGAYGFEALGQILSGTVNPSGKLPDTWVYDNYSAAASENFGDQAADNYSGANYVDYVEGIYVGYKWYETAYAEGAVVTNTTNGVTYDFSDYDSIVAFPFGYGLSYTTFSQEITGGTLTDGLSLDARGTYTVEVTVTNTGDVAGKEAVQIYVTAPYTDYDKQNGVEKAAVSLVGIGKTDLLQPGASQVVTVEVEMQNIASYDTTHDNGDGTTGSYMLDEGDYVFSARANAHTALDSITTQLSSTYFFSGDNKRDDDDQAAYNQMSDAARGIYLSRQDGFANYTAAMNSVSTSVEDTSYDEDRASYDASYDEVVTKTYVEGVDYAAEGDLTLMDMVGLDYDDPQWDDLIKQLTIDELKSLVTDATYTSPALESIDKAKTCDSDGALGLSSMFAAQLNGTGYPCIPLLAATFNTELAYKMGSYMADECHGLGVTGWYAPAMDTHRWAFSGRNFEYFSEDGMLAGIMGSAESKGCRDKGLIVYIKHFALNDQETNRSSRLHTYTNEQAAREIYLKPFEMCVKRANVTAIMNSMNYIGDTFAGCYEPLMTEILRNEWGFHGKVLTDMSDDTACVNYALRAGTDSWLILSSMDVRAETDADIYYLQRTAHNVLYMEANAASAAVEIEDWHLYVNIVTVELVALVVACGVALVLRNKKKAAQ
jgi:beta-glucosidase